MAEAGTTLATSFCHQCRRTSTRPKMLCSNTIQDRACGKRFCNRCILCRYPDITFDQHSTDFICPVCANSCNCSFCSRNRGEEFISMRVGGLAASLLNTKVKLVQDTDKQLPYARSPPLANHVDARGSASETSTLALEPGMPPTQPEFWAHVYGIGGERIGSAFVTHESIECLQAPESSLSLPLSEPPKKASRPTSLASSRTRMVHDQNLGVAVEITQSKERGKGRGKRKKTRRRQCSAANLPQLQVPSEQVPSGAGVTPTFSHCSTPVLNLDGSLTPLSELEKDNPMSRQSPPEFDSDSSLTPLSELEADYLMHIPSHYSPPVLNLGESLMSSSDFK